jgi:hypothetical protein
MLNVSIGNEEALNSVDFITLKIDFLGVLFKLSKNSVYLMDGMEK